MFFCNVQTHTHTVRERGKGSKKREIVEGRETATDHYRTHSTTNSRITHTARTPDFTTGQVLSSVQVKGRAGTHQQKFSPTPRGKSTCNSLKVAHMRKFLHTCTHRKFLKPRTRILQREEGSNKGPEPNSVQ